MWLFVAFLAVPLIEIALFVQVGGAIGLFPTLAIVIITAILGTYLVRAQGFAALTNLRQSFSQLSDPTEHLAHGAMILFAGALLLTPGFFTDAIGLLCLWLPARAVFIGAALEALLPHIITMRPNTARAPPPQPKRADDGKTIEGDFRIDDE